MLRIGQMAVVAVLTIDQADQRNVNEMTKSAVNADNITGGLK